MIPLLYDYDSSLNVVHRTYCRRGLWTCIHWDSIVVRLSCKRVNQLLLLLYMHSSHGNQLYSTRSSSLVVEFRYSNSKPVHLVTIVTIVIIVVIVIWNSHGMMCVCLVLG